MLDPHRIRVFRSVVASGSVQAAADNLGLTSSAVSQHLSALQRETGLTLFHRVGRGIVPTEAALVLDRRTDDVMSEWVHLEGVVEDLREGRLDRLSIGYFASAGSCRISRSMRRSCDSTKTAAIAAVTKDSTLNPSSTTNTEKIREVCVLGTMSP